MVDTRSGKFRNYTQSFSGKWNAQDELRIPFEIQFMIFMRIAPARNKIALMQKNPFAIANYRLGVRSNFIDQIFQERYEEVKLSDEEIRTLFCAAALNAYYGALIGTNYTFQK